MKLSKLFVGLALTTFLCVSHAQRWVEILETESTAFFIKSGSVGLAQTDGKEYIFFALGKTYTKQAQKVEDAIWYIRVNDCFRKTGKFAVANMNGALQFDTDFTFGNGVVASTLAEVICGVGIEAVMPEKPGKQQRL